jgi:hypothetical protein
MPDPADLLFLENDDFVLFFFHIQVFLKFSQAEEQAGLE